MTDNAQDAQTEAQDGKDSTGAVAGVARMLARDASTLAAIGGVVALGLSGSTDPTTTVFAVAGLGGYRMRQPRQ